MGLWYHVIMKNTEGEKNSFDYDCPIETRNLSIESTKVDSFILSTKKTRQLGFKSAYGGKEICSLL